MAKKKTQGDPTSPPVSVLVKLGSLAVHVEEFLSPGAHEFDKAAIDSLLNDDELREWIIAMSAMGFMPVKRTATR